MQKIEMVPQTGPMKVSPTEAANINKKVSNDCENADLNQIPDSPFQRIPVYDQDGTGLCYAYTSSQMIDFYRFKLDDQSHGLTNPIYTGFVAKRGWLANTNDPLKAKASTSIDAEDPAHAYDAIRINEACSDADVKKRLAEFSKAGGNISEPEVMRYLEIMYHHFKGQSATYNSKKLSTQLQKEIPNLKCERHNILKEFLIQKNYLSLAPTAILEKIFEDCPLHPLPELPNLKTFGMGPRDSTDKALSSRINASLNNGLPVQTTLCANVLHETQYRGLKNRIQPPLYRADGANAKKDCGLHAVIISGKNRINGQCNYLIRNSWGSSWRPNSATACACITRNGQYKQDCKKSEAKEFVGCWFKQKDIVPNTRQVDVFN